MAVKKDYSGMTLRGRTRDYRLEKAGGSGGEGCIYTLQGEPALVAKIYHEDRYTTAPKDRAYQQRKLEAMLKLKFDPRYRGHWCFAWPQDILFCNGRMVGYIMPRIGTQYMLSSVYGDTCAQVFPGWTWQTMTLVAYNLAVNVAALHRSGIVAGDLNPANMMVDPTNHLVSMIDCDSYDIRDPDTGEHFPCMVGSAEVLAPELQMVGNLSSPKAKFTKESDNFSLAILIFKLLMNGYDPFAKRSLNPGGSTPAVTNVNMDILTGASVYVRAIPGKARPLGAPDFSILPQEVQDLFQKVFTYGAYPDFMKKIPLRPTAEQWCTAMDKMYLSMNQKSQWTQCAADPHHLYPAGLSSCPWCRARKDLENYLKQSFGTAAVPAAPAAPANQTGPAAAAASAQRSPWLFLALMTAFSVLGGVLFGPQLAAVSSMGLSASDLQIITSLVGAGISIAIAVHFWKRYPAAASPWPYWLFSASMCLLTPLATVVLAAVVAMVLEVLEMVFMCLFGVGLFVSLLGGG